MLNIITTFSILIIIALLILLAGKIAENRMFIAERNGLDIASIDNRELYYVDDSGNESRIDTVDIDRFGYYRNHLVILSGKNGIVHLCHPGEAITAVE